MRAPRSLERRHRVSRERTPRLASPRLWALALLLAIALYVLGLQIDHLWPELGPPGRAVAAFIAAGTIGEFYVHNNWPALRMSPSESRDVSVGFLLIAGIVAIMLALVDAVLGVVLPVTPLAWTAYIAMVVFDGAHRY